MGFQTPKDLCGLPEYPQNVNYRMIVFGLKFIKHSATFTLPGVLNILQRCLKVCNPSHFEILNIYSILLGISFITKTL